MPTAHTKPGGQPGFPSRPQNWNDEQVAPPTPLKSAQTHVSVQLPPVGVLIPSVHWHVDELEQHWFVPHVFDGGGQMHVVHVPSGIRGDGHVTAAQRHVHVARSSVNPGGHEIVQTHAHEAGSSVNGGGQPVSVHRQLHVAGSAVRFGAPEHVRHWPFAQQTPSEYAASHEMHVPFRHVAHGGHFVPQAPQWSLFDRRSTHGDGDAPSQHW